MVAYSVDPVVTAVSQEAVEGERGWLGCGHRMSLTPLKRSQTARISAPLPLQMKEDDGVDGALVLTAVFPSLSSPACVSSSPIHEAIRHE